RRSDASNKLVPKHSRFELKLRLEGRMGKSGKTLDFSQQFKGIEPLQIRACGLHKCKQSLDLYGGQAFVLRYLRNEKPRPIRVIAALGFLQNCVMCLLAD